MTAFLKDCSEKSPKAFIADFVFKFPARFSEDIGRGFSGEIPGAFWMKF